MRIGTLRSLVTTFTLVSTLCFSGYASAEIKITDARGEQSFAQTPERVVVLNWDLLEQVLELGVTPIAAPNVPGYQEWVVQPEAPESIEDIGTRAEPNMERLSALKPDVIIAASPQKDLIANLEKIAPVVYLPNFDANEDSAEVAISHFRTLGKLLGKETQAEQKLSDMAAVFEELKSQINQAYPTPPQVLPIRFSNPTSVFLFTENSTTEYVIKQLGLTNPMPQPAAAWGITQQRFQTLQHAKGAYVFYILPFPQEKKLQSSVLWKAMPFVRQGHVGPMDAVWSYGGAMSLQYTAQALTKSLLEVAPK